MFIIIYEQLHCLQSIFRVFSRGIYMPNKRKLSVYEALNELHLINKKINKLMLKFQPAEIQCCGLTEVSQNPRYISSQYKRLNALLARRETYSMAIATSNRITQVKFKGKVLSLTELLQIKNNLTYRKQLYNLLSERYEHIINKYNSQQTQFELALDNYNKLQQTLTCPSVLTLNDPLEFETLITTLENEVDKDLQEINVLINAYNTKTFIFLEE